MKQLLRSGLRRFALSAAFAVGALAAAGCESTFTPDSGDSSMLLNQGASAEGGFARTAFAALNVNSPVKRLYYRDGVVFVYTDKNLVYTLGKNLDLKAIQQVATPDVTVWAPLVYGDRKDIIFPTGASLEIYKSDGTLDRSVTLPAAVTTDVTLDQRGLLLAATASPTGGRLSVIDPKKKARPIVEETLIGTIASRPVGFQAIAYIASSDGRIFAVADGSVAMWPLPRGSFDIDRPISADLAVDDYAVYAAGNDGVLYALDRANGKIKWRYIAQHPLASTPLLTPNAVYQVVPEVGLVAIDKVEGKPYREPVWTVADVKQVLCSDGKLVFVAMSGNRLGAVDVKTGALVYTIGHKFDLFARNDADGTVYAATKGGSVMAIGTSRFGTNTAGTGSAK